MEHTGHRTDLGVIMRKSVVIAVDLEAVCFHVLVGSNWCYVQLGCAHHCESNALGTKCVCRNGYQLHSNGKDCVGTSASFY